MRPPLGSRRGGRERAAGTIVGHPPGRIARVAHSSGAGGSSSPRRWRPWRITCRRGAIRGTVCAFARGARAATPPANRLAPANRRAPGCGCKRRLDEVWALADGWAGAESITGRVRATIGLRHQARHCLLRRWNGATGECECLRLSNGQWPRLRWTRARLYRLVTIAIGTLHDRFGWRWARCPPHHAAAACSTAGTERWLRECLAIWPNHLTSEARTLPLHALLTWRLLPGGVASAGRLRN